MGVASEAQLQHVSKNQMQVVIKTLSVPLSVGGNLLTPVMPQRHSQKLLYLAPM